MGRNSNLEGSPLHTYIPGYSVVLPHKECMHHSQIWLLIHPEISCIKAGFWIPASFPDLIWIGYWRKKLLLTSSPSLRLEKATIEFSEKMSYYFILLIFLSSSDYHCVVLEIYIRTNILAPIPEISIFFFSWPIDIWAVKPACYLIDLLCWSRTAIQSRGTIWAHKVLAFHLALGEWIGTWDVNGEAIVNLLSVIPLLKTAAVQLLIERNMSNVMVNKLPKLHHHHCGWCGGTFNPFPQCVGYFPDLKWIWIYRILLLQYHTKQFQR